MSTAKITAAARAARKKSSKNAPSRQQKRVERQLAEGRGEIERGKDYPIALFKKRTGLGDYAIRQCEDKGLFIHVIGNERRITGDDWHNYLDAQRKAQEAEKAGA